MQEHGGIKTREEAERVVDAVFETLSERLSRTETRNLAAQLPDELKEKLFRRLYTDRFVLRDFYNRVSARAGVGYPHAIKLARVVLITVREAISPGEWEDVVSEFPSEYEDLFEKKPDDPVSMVA